MDVKTDASMISMTSMIRYHNSRSNPNPNPNPQMSRVGLHLSSYGTNDDAVTRCTNKSHLSADLPEDEFRRRGRGLWEKTALRKDTRLQRNSMSTSPEKD